MTSKDVFPFFSDGWIEAVEEELQALVDVAGDDGASVRFTLAETYRDAPAGVPGESGGCVGLVMAIADGRARIRRGHDAAFDVGIEAYWPDAIEAVRLVGADYEASRAQRYGNGRLRFSGDLTKVPAFLGPLHDRIAARTA
ncbi:MAG: hypothetical protein J7499_00750 [Sphingopyxis sp.]|nr:hypothetical protein [Sphingopyxis sp.]